MAHDKSKLDEKTRKQNEQLIKILRNLSDAIEEGIEIKKGELAVKSVEANGEYVGLAKIELNLMVSESTEFEGSFPVKIQKERTDETDKIIQTLDKQLVKRKYKELEQVQKRYKLIQEAMAEPNDDYNKAWRVQYILDGKMDDE